MSQSNAKSLLDTTAMLYKQSASSRHDVCLDQRSFKCKIGENCSKYFIYIGAKFKFYVPFYPNIRFFNAILLGMCLLCLESNDLPSFPR